ncbi:LOW QUALITY PROTEIN: hemicentin-1-like [Aphomia sociella]
MIPKKFLLTFVFVLLKIITITCEKKTSLTFVVDDTYSMTQEIKQVKDGARKILNIILDKRSSQIENLIHISLNDPDVLVKTITTDRHQFEKSLALITTHGQYNYDWPEPSMRATKLALEKSLPGSDVYVFTDSPAKDSVVYEDVIALSKKQIQVVFVLTEDFEGYENYKGVNVFYKIAEACSGQAFVLGKIDVQWLFPYITETAKGSKNVITSKQVKPNAWTDIKFTIDDKTEFAIVSTSGKNVQLSVTGPSIKTETVTWISNVKSLKLINPVAGEYVARVWSSQYASVIVFARTDFTFVHGFSELIPKSLKDTIAQPITGTKSHLSVSVSDSDHNVRIKHAQILDMNEKIIKEVPLHQIGKDLYTTDDFLWPDFRFKIAIIGTGVHTGRPIRRLANTPVEPQKPKPPNKKLPVVTIGEGAEAKVDYDGTLVLTCNVNAYPPPNIEWKDSKNKKLPSQNATIELPYKHISYLRLSNVKSSARYYCYASNDVGTSNTEFIAVKVNSPFTVHDYTKDILTRIAYKTEGILKCKITSKLPMKITWKHFDKLVQEWNVVKPKEGVYSISDDETELKIISIDLYEDGVYSCSAVLKDDGYKGPTLRHSVQITNLVQPLLDKKDPIIIVKRNDTVLISCKVRYGNPKPKIEMLFRNEDSEKYEFVKLIDDQLVIASAQLHDAGRYKCMAVNVAGRDDTLTQLVVEAAPSFINDKTTFYAVEDDIVLKIPCDVVGYPKPVITWKMNETLIQPDEKYEIYDNYLVIKHPNINDTNDYICTATNKEGTVQKKFNVEVDDNLYFDETFGNWRDVYLRENEPMTLFCHLPISDTDSVQWYLDGSKMNFTGKHLNLNKEVTTSDDGNYTCRVSNKDGSVSQTYMVDVGSPPTLRQSDEPSIVTINWDGTDGMMDCDVNAKPHATAEWTYNGKIIKNSLQLEQTILGWGTYICRVSNVHGRIERQFKITSKGCLINRNIIHSPIIVNDKSKLSNFGELKNYMNIQPENELQLSCHNGNKISNYFENLPNKTELIVYCDHEDKFRSEDKLYDFSQFQCHETVLPAVHRTGQLCSNENTELIYVGFKTNDFVNVFDVCFDTVHNIPLYTKVEITEVNIIDKAEIEWYNDEDIANSMFDNTYSCMGIHNNTCCYDKRQLVNSADVAHGPAQFASFISQVNAIPVWIPCDKKVDPWTVIEKAVIDYCKFDSVTVWSGTSKPENLNGKYVPRYLWKVVKFKDDDVRVIVHVNNPSPVESDIICENVCVNVAWMAELDKFTYCCAMEDFINYQKTNKFPIFTFDY